MIHKWTELAKKQLECRIYCPACDSSILITANDNAFFWANEKAVGLRSILCDSLTCRKPIRIQKTQDGVVEVLS